MFFELPVSTLYHKLRPGSIGLFPYKTVCKLYSQGKFQTPIQKTGILNK